MKYFIKTPWLLKKIYSSYVWNINTKEKLLFLSFDDGPDPVSTPFVLKQLKQYNALASFFCIGKNVETYPELYKQILDEGHTTGNHTYHHLNGWKTGNKKYLDDVAEAARYIHTSLFRPPYGRIKSFQAKNIPAAIKDPLAKIIMWDVLSGDFDQSITKEQCLKNVVLNANKGSIIVFHDSAKAFPVVEFCLPRTLDFFSAKGFRFASLANTNVYKDK
jgi:peptidoglycan/xylan/chitin deacetylase (PgdA/CDA1 family)